MSTSIPFTPSCSVGVNQKMATQSSQEDLHIVYNFFEKIQKPPEQDSYLDGMKYIFQYVRKQPSFVLGQLHQNLDPNGMYPFVNYVGFCNGDFHAFQDIRQPPSKEWIEVVEKGLGPRGTQKSSPGGYQELATFSGDPMCTKPPKEGSYYVLVNYKEADVGESNFAAFEADWKAKAGATILESSLPADVKHGDVGLYRRRRAGITPFMYVLRLEILPGSPRERLLAELPALRTKLTNNGVPFSDVSAYEVCFVGTPSE